MKTIRNTTPPTSIQDVFNRAWDRLVTHKDLDRCMRKHENGNKTCSYRQGDNYCVIGWMLPDELITPLLKLEEQSAPAMNTDIGSLMNEREDTYQVKVCEFFNEVVTDYSDSNLIILIKLQNLHDNELDSDAERERELRALAKSRNLSVPTT